MRKLLFILSVGFLTLSLTNCHPNSKGYSSNITASAKSKACQKCKVNKADCQKCKVKKSSHCEKCKVNKADCQKCKVKKANCQKWKKKKRLSGEAKSGSKSHYKRLPEGSEPKSY